MENNANLMWLRICNIWVWAFVVSGIFAQGAGIAKAIEADETDEPFSYVKENTWSETMLATRQALMNHKATKGFKPFVSEVILGEQPAQYISVDISEIDTLGLLVNNGGDRSGNDSAIWGEPKLTAKDGSKTSLNDLDPIFVNIWHGKFRRNKDLLDRLLQIGDQKLKSGIWVTAPNEIHYKLNRQYQSFESWVGVDFYAGINGSVRFKVFDKQPRLEQIWQKFKNDFPVAAKRMEQDAAAKGGHLSWFNKIKSVELEKVMIGRLLDEVGPVCKDLRREFDSLGKIKAPPDDKRWLDLYEKAVKRLNRLDNAGRRLKLINLDNLRLTIEDLTDTFPQRYSKGAEYLKHADYWKKNLPEITNALASGDETVLTKVDDILAFQREVLLGNPLIDFDRMLMVKREVKDPIDYNVPIRTWHVSMGLGRNDWCHASVPPVGYNNEIAVHKFSQPEGEMNTFYQPPGSRYVGHVDLHFDADHLLFTMPDGHDKYQIFEMNIDGSGLRQVSKGEHDDVDNFDACYLPNGKIIFASTASYQTVPCWDGMHDVSSLYIMDANGDNVRQLCYDQDHNFHPAVLNDGQIIFTRWEYSGIPHFFSRLLMIMNPDGTGQRSYYGTNSYWPNALFYAKPIPGDPSKVAAIVGGYHGVPRMGELVILDSAHGRHEADGVVGRIGDRGKAVEPIIEEQLVYHSWPKFLHPYPLSDKYFIMSCRPDENSAWGIYLVDVFDNMLLLCERSGYALLEPIPIRKTAKPPVIPELVDLEQKEGVVYLQDVYLGPGLGGVPRGTIKKLRVLSYHFAYRGTGGHIKTGIDGPWDVMRILGTVPINNDGSASFRVPANTPIAVQPLDDEGKAIQLMRSWFTVMPGESISCVGCHERMNQSPPNFRTIATLQHPVEITPWYGPARGFDFEREVQPVLDKYCVGCHDGQNRDDGRIIPDLRSLKHRPDYKGRMIDGRNMPKEILLPTLPEYRWLKGVIRFTPAYETLHPYTRRVGLESDIRLLLPGYYHTDTSKLIQMLSKGHNNIRLDDEAWDRLITWIDLNVPCHGTWNEVFEVPNNADRRRLELRKQYGGPTDDPEAIPEIARKPFESVTPEPFEETNVETPKIPGWPFDPLEARKRQDSVGLGVKYIDLGNGVILQLVPIPAGEFVMGDANGEVDEKPLTRVSIDESFWMSACEITNQQYGLFDPNHDSLYIKRHSKDQFTRGYPLNGPQQPVVRISWKEAMAYCEWLSKRTGMQFTLPTEAQWEYACRAGTNTPLHYGDLDTDFSPWENLADAMLSKFARDPRPDDTPDWILKDSRFDDGALVTTEVGLYQVNAWGLHDMHGNAAEWTRTSYKSYPYCDEDDHNNPDTKDRKVVRGGSWYDRPKEARSSFRLAYRPWQKVFNVGFRVVCNTR
ncbi:MAG: SUMF1/EgtB/PvdO family nonheme iron enzyme [Planctomycetota bacterium]|nr:MAG: SUMF1/EgtB/PvdO family nonheme iron enzyme [Planctomycetota bacterium]